MRVGLGLGLLAIAGLGLRAVTDEPTAQASLTMATLGGSTHASSPAEEAIPDGSSAPPALAGSGGRGTGGTSKVPGRRASALPAPDGGGFYEPPSPLPQGKPGDVIWYRPAKATTPLGAQSLASVDAWQVLYLSTDVRGRPAERRDAELQKRHRQFLQVRSHLILVSDRRKRNIADRAPV